MGEQSLEGILVDKKIIGDTPRPVSEIETEYELSKEITRILNEGELTKKVMAAVGASDRASEYAELDRKAGEYATQMVDEHRTDLDKLSDQAVRQLETIRREVVYASGDENLIKQYTRYKELVAKIGSVRLAERAKLAERAERVELSELAKRNN